MPSLEPWPFFAHTEQFDCKVIQISSQKNKLDEDDLKIITKYACFSASKEPNLCNRLTQIIYQTHEPLNEFYVIVVVKCARMFIWYELAYRYFQAAWTNSYEIPFTQDSDYKSNCGMLVLF